VKALVVGGSGFIGSHLVDRLAATGREVVVLDPRERRYDALPPEATHVEGGLEQPSRLARALEGVDVVYHLAWTTIHEVSNRDPVADVETNLVPTLRLLEACRDRGVERVVFSSSGGTVYGPVRRGPVPETHLPAPVTSYGITKLAVELYLHLFHRLHGRDNPVLRSSAPYGPRQDPLARQGAVSVFLYRVARGLPVDLWGDGSVTRDYFYVSDLVDALVACAERSLSGPRTFNLGGAEELSLTQLIERVEEAVGSEAIVRRHPARAFDAPRIVLDTGLAADELGWRPRVDLVEGLRRTAEWIERTFE
jgi:UDP-glucose 4-epimerase